MSRIWLVAAIALGLLVGGCGRAGGTQPPVGESSDPSPTLAPTATPGAKTARPEPTRCAVATDVAHATGPTARGYHSMTTLGPGAGVLLFGGETAPPPSDGVGLSDTWEYSVAEGWRAIGDSPGRWGGGLTFDTDSDRAVVIVELCDLQPAPLETWSYVPAAGRWEEVLADGPNRSAFRTAYDSGSDRIVVAGPWETWILDLDAGTWQRMAGDGGPAGRTWQATAYDPGSDRVIMFGGESSGSLSDETWAFDVDSDTWTNLTPTSRPSPRLYADMVYDPMSGRIILFGGADGVFPDEQPLGDTWAYDPQSNAWTELSPAAAPSARGWHAMAYSELDRAVVLFGGGADRDSFLGDTWLFDGATNTWVEAPAP